MAAIANIASSTMNVSPPNVEGAERTSNSSTSNLLAVELLRRGYPMQAQNQLKEAIAHVRDELVVEAAPAAAAPSTHSSRPYLQSVDIEGGAPNGAQDSWFAMFKKAFVIVTPLPSPSINGEQPGSSNNNNAQQVHTTHVTLHSVVLMYNMALATHVMAISQGSDLILRRAVRVYQRVQWLLSQQAANLNGSGVDAVFLACVNNIGHIHNLLLNEVGMRSCYSRLQAMVVEVQQRQVEQQQQGQDMGMRIDPEDVAFFSFTVIIWGPALAATLTTLPLAPAA